MKIAGLVALLTGCQAVHNFVEQSRLYQESIDVKHSYHTPDGTYEVFVDGNDNCKVDFVGELDLGWYITPHHCGHPNMGVEMRLLREYCPK